MGGKRKPRPGGHAAVAYRDGQQATESLPYPTVLYPGHYGAFFAFSSPDDPDRLYMCSCAEPAVTNYLVLAAQKGRHDQPHRMAPLDSHHFPLAVATRSLEVEDPWRVVAFVPGICHRCNLTRPSMNYCHPMYGGQFMQGFGWYVNQAFYRLGVAPRARWSGTAEELIYLGHSLLEDLCPPELVELVQRARNVTAEYRKEFDRLNQMVNSPPRDSIGRDEVTFWQNVKLCEAEDYKRLRRDSAQTERRVTTFVENLVRQEFGFREVGGGWVSEALLLQLVSRILPGHEALRHDRPLWLEGLELDIFIPDLHLGIEYQGQQHFHAIRAWGGDEALARVQQRDARKLELCRAFGITLVTVDYTEPLTEAHIREVLGDYMRG